MMDNQANGEKRPNRKARRAAKHQGMIFVKVRDVRSVRTVSGGLCNGK